jgi:hypothetical protein
MESVGNFRTFTDTSAFKAGLKEKITNTNKIIIAKNQKLATQNFFFNSAFYGMVREHIQLLGLLFDLIWNGIYNLRVYR